MEAGLKEDTAGTDQTIKAHLDLDDEDFTQRWEVDQARAKDFGNQKYAPTFDADDTDLRAKLDEVQNRAQALADETYELKPTADTEEAIAELDDLKQKAAELRDASYPLHVSTDGVEQVAAELDDLEAKLDEFGARDVQAQVSIGGADGASRDLNNLGSSAGDAGDGLGGLIGVAKLVGPALIPIGVVAVASIGGIAAMGIQAAGGLGVFALAAKPVVTALNTAATAQQKYSTAVEESGKNSTQAQSALLALHTALSQLTPAEQSAAVGLANFKTAYQAWSQSFDPTILPLLAGGINIARTAMSEFTPIVGSVGKALQGVEQNVEATLSSGFTTRFLTIFGGQSSAAITTFSNVLIGAGQAFAGLDEAFQPLIVSMEAGLDSLATKLGNFGAGAPGSAGIQSFIAYVQREGPVVGATIVQIGEDIGILAKDLAPLGASYLSGLELIAKAIGVIGTFSPGLVQTAAALLSLGKAAQILNGVGALSAVTGGLKAIVSVGATYGISATAEGLTTMAVSAGGLIGSMGALGITLGEVAGPAGLAAAGLLSLTNIMSKGLDDQAGGASQFVKSFVAGLSGVADPIAAVKAEIASLGQQMTVTGAAIRDIQAHPITDASADAGQKLSETLEQLNDKSNDLKGILPGLQSDQDAYTAAQRASAGATAASSAQVQTLADKLAAAKSPAAAFAISSQAVASALQAESGDATTLSNSLNVLVGTYLSAQAATLAQKQAVFSFSDALKAAHGDITGNSQASITAQQSANSFASSLYGTMIPALAKQHVSVAQATTDVQGQIKAFDAAATSAGLTAAQVQALNEKYGLLPPNVTTAFHDSGYAQVVADADNARAAAEAFAKTYTATLNEVITVSGASTTLGRELQGGVQGATPTHNARGTDFHPGGLSWVGEEGPELLNLPRGSKVVPNGKSMDMARSGMVNLPGYAGGVGLSGFDLGYQFGTQVNTGVDQALASDKHPVNLGLNSPIPAKWAAAGRASGSGSSPQPSWWQSRAGGQSSFASGAYWPPAQQGPPALPNYPTLTTGDVNKAIADLTSIQKAAKTTSTVVEAQGVQMIESFTSKVKSGADVSESTLQEIAGKLPASIGDAILKAGPLTTSGLLSLYRSLARTTAGSADIQAVANLLPSSIVTELEKAGPLTVAATKSMIDKLAGELTTAGADITKGLAGSSAQLASSVTAAVALVDKGFKGSTIDAFVDGLGKQFDYLESKAKVSLASVTKDLTAAQTALTSIQKQIAQNASTLEGQFSIIPTAKTPTSTSASQQASVGGALDISGITGQVSTNPYTGSTWTAPVGASDIVAALRKEVADLGKYKTDLLTLKSWGLSEELLAQFVAAGPAGLPAAEALIAGGKSTVNLVDALQSQVDTSTSGIAAYAPPPAAAATPTAPPPTSTDIIANLRASVAQLTTYKAVLTKLKSWGLSIEILQQLVSAGPAAGLATAQALLSGGKKEVSLADVLQGEVDSTSTAIATLSASATIGGKTVGLAQATGIVDGLKASQTKITDELRLLASDIKTVTNQALEISGGSSGQFKEVGKYLMYGLQQGIHDNTGPVKAEVLAISESMKADIKKALGIKSPSSVFAEIGGNVGAGLAQGISGTQELVSAALSSVYTGLTTKAKEKSLAFDAGTLSSSIGAATSGITAPAPIVFNDQRQVIVGNLATKADITKALDADRNEIIKTLGRLR